MADDQNGAGGPPAASIDDRYGRILAVAPRFKEATGATNEWLGCQIGVDKSCVTRFLARSSGYEPQLGRPKMMKILVRLEVLMDRPEPIQRLPAEDYRTLEGTDVHQAFCDSLWVGRYQRSSEDVGHALAALRDSALAATLFPVPYRSPMCTNILLTVGVLLERAVDEIKGGRRCPVTTELLRATLARTDRAERIALTDESLTEPSGSQPGFRTSHGKVACYGGFCFVMGGLCLHDLDSLSRGFESLSRAVSLAAEKEAGVWPNVSIAINAALDVMPAESRSHAARFYHLAEQAGDETLATALTKKALPALKAEWINWKHLVQRWSHGGNGHAQES